MTRQRFTATAAFSCLLIHLFMGNVKAEFLGEFPTGILELEEKYPYYLFVPEEYSPDKPLPMAVFLGKDPERAKEIVQAWSEWAKLHNAILLVTSVSPREGTVPNDTDKWILEVKKEVKERYHVLPTQILLIGMDTEAPYAGYLGLRYPEEFSAIALFGKGWSSSMAPLAEGHSNPLRQVPFYVAADPNAESFTEVESEAARLEKKGYQIHFDPLKAGEDMAGHKDRMIQWFTESADLRKIRQEQKAHSNWKGRMGEIRKNVFGF